MISHSFTTDEALKVDNEALKAVAGFAPEKNSQYDIVAGGQEAGSKIGNSGDIYVETTGGGLQSLHAIIKAKKGESHNVTPNDMVDTLMGEFKLSQWQAEYVIKANAADKMASATGAFGALQTEVLIEAGSSNFPVHRTMGMSKVMISKEGDVTYSAGNKILFDCPEGSNTALIQKFPKLTDDYLTKDFVTINMSVNLGKQGDQSSQPIIIDVAGEGKTGQEFVTKLKGIESKQPSKKPEKIVEDYAKFSEPLYEASGVNEQHKQAIIATLSSILNPGKLTDDQREDLLEKEGPLLKKFNSTPQILAETLVEKIHAGLTTEGKKKDSIINETVENLKQFFPGKKDGYLKLAAEDLVRDIDKARHGGSYKEEKKNIIQKFVTAIKKLWHGYEGNKFPPELINEAVQVVSKAKDKMANAPTGNTTNTQGTRQKSGGIIEH